MAGPNLPPISRRSASSSADGRACEIHGDIIGDPNWKRLVIDF